MYTLPPPPKKYLIATKGGVEGCRISPWNQVWKMSPLHCFSLGLEWFLSQCPEMGPEVDVKRASTHVNPRLHPKTHFLPAFGDPFEEIDLRGQHKAQAGSPRPKRQRRELWRCGCSMLIRLGGPLALRAA